MSKPNSNHSFTDARKSGDSMGVTSSPAAPPVVPHGDAPPSSKSFLFFLAGFGLLAVIGLVAIVWSNAGNVSSPTTQARFAKPPRPSWEPVSAEDRICDQFMKLRAVGDPAADELLGRVPAVPEQPFATEDELERMQVDFYLRDPNTRILSIRREPPLDDTPHYRFTTEGNVAPPRLPIQKRNEVERWGRAMFNVTAIVEVRDGKLFGIKSE